VNDCVADVLPRHPNILQIYGVASSGSIHAAVFHGGTSSSLNLNVVALNFAPDLMRQHDFGHLHEHSPVLKVYITASTVCAWHGVPLVFDDHDDFQMEQFNVWDSACMLNCFTVNC
jgi:hypothetical protein